MHRGKGMKFVGDSRIKAERIVCRINQKIIPNIQVKQKLSGLISY